MLKTIFVHTLWDEPEEAVDDIMGQIDAEGGLLRNSAGLLYCYIDYVDRGVVKAVCEKLPFPIAGCTTNGMAFSGLCEPCMVAVVILTSDDLNFSVSLSQCVRKSNSRLFERAVPENAGVLLGFFPALVEGLFDNALDRVYAELAKVPLFGTIAMDFENGMRRPLVVCSADGVYGEYDDRVAVVAISGAVKPRFYAVNSLRHDRNSRYATITRADKNIVYSINNIPALDYFESLGLVKDRHFDGRQFSTFMWIDYHDKDMVTSDGEKVYASCMFLETRGSGVAGTRILHNGDGLVIETISQDEVLDGVKTMSSRILDSFKKDGQPSLLLFFSCVSRSFLLSEPDSEVRILENEFGKASGHSLPYMFAYSGGEFCPWQARDGSLRNFFHQFTLTCCAL